MEEDKNDLSDTKINQNEISLNSLEQALKQKYNSLLEDINHVDKLISELQAEYSSKLEALYSNKKTNEEALNHISALLKLEGYSDSKPKIKNLSPNTVENSITDSAYNLLFEIHRPMHYKDIADSLKNRGIHISGINASATLLSRISRDDRFKRVKRGTYGLKGWRKTTIRKKVRVRKTKIP